MPRKTAAAHIRHDSATLPMLPDTRFRRHKSHGQTTRVGVCAWMYDLFTANEQLPVKRRMNNETIEDRLFREFPHRKALIDGIKSKDKSNSIALMRLKYNLGTLCTWLKPVFLSVRYNQHGKAVDTRTGTKPLTKLDYLDMLSHFGLTFETHANKELYNTLPG